MIPVMVTGLAMATGLTMLVPRRTAMEEFLGILRGQV